MSYPDKLATHAASSTTLRFVQEKSWIRNYAEFGVYEGATCLEVAKILADRSGSIDLFDFQHRVDECEARLKDLWGAVKVVGHGNTEKLLDSYCWSLLRILDGKPVAARDRLWDYVFIDGPHSWAVDGYALLLCDRMIRPGGFVELDDARWTLQRSPTLNPTVFPETAQLYTDEQIKTAQVSKIIEHIIPFLGYTVVVKDRVFNKPK
jgi:predicted O-methyltransferase YrrM